MIWVALHLPLLSLEAFAATLPPDQRDLPLALLHRSRLVALNPVAAALGLQVQMKRATALALAPHTLFGQAHPQRDRQALQAVVHAALVFTPSVTVRGARTVLLEVSTTQRAFGGLGSLLERLRLLLEPLGLSTRLATAPTATGAALLVRWQAAELPLIGEHTHSLEASRSLLDQVPVGLLTSTREHRETLQVMGLARLADLRALPRDGLARRFGPAVLAELDAARGDAVEAHVWQTLPDAFQARLELFARADSTEQVLYAAQILLARLVAWAGARRGRVRRLHLSMLHEPRHRQDDDTPAQSVLEIALAEPSNDIVHMGVLLRERLARMPLPAPTHELRIACRDLAASEAPNAELFPTRASAEDGLLRLIERLQARLGPERVARLQPQADHRPERSTAWQPMAPGERSAAAAASLPPTGQAGSTTAAQPASMTRPVWLLDPPQPLADQASSPRLEGRPLRVLAGPERIESGWWDGALVTRDYYVAQAHDGSLVWIYRSRLPDAAEAETDTQDPPGGASPARPAAAGEWFLHGRFA